MTGLVPSQRKPVVAMNYMGMTNDQIKWAVESIICTSHSEAEVKQRVRDELMYPYSDSISLCSELPTDQVGREERALVLALGGLVMANGAMVMFMMHGHDGTIIG